MKWTIALLALLALYLPQSASAVEMFGFTITHPKAGWIGLAEGELRFFPGDIRPESPEYLVWTASSPSDRVQIWREPTRGDPEKKYLAIGRSSDELSLLLQAAPFTAWKWTEVGTRGDAKIAHLEVIQGSAKGKLLGIENITAEFTPKDGRKAQTVHKLKLVEMREQALTFTVFHVAP